jgi:PBSX family phage terminase large subunit
MQTTIKPDFFPAQRKFMDSTKKEVLYSGAFRAGKSLALCYQLIKQVIRNPTNSVLLCRKTCSHLPHTTLKTLLEGDDSPPVLPPNSYKHHQKEQYIQLNGGGRIYYFGLNDPMKIFSMSLGAVGIDEAIELEEGEYLKLLGRLSLKSGTRQMFLVTNPGVPGHWLYKRFFENKHHNREVIIAKTIDNPHLPPDYIESLKDYPETLYRRFALGEWTTLEGAVFTNFNRKINLTSVDYTDLYWNEYYIGVDIGFTDPSCLLLIGKKGSRLTVIREFYKTRCLQDRIIKEIQDMYRWCNNPCSIIVDPSQAGLIATLESLGFPVKKANNDIYSGISLIRQALEKRTDIPDLMIDSSCINLIKEMELYCYKPGTENPIDKFNHAIDSLRYVLNEILVDDTGPKPFVIDMDDAEDL